MKRRGEWIRHAYQVDSLFPFVQGVLYDTIYHSTGHEHEVDGRRYIIQAMKVQAINGLQGVETLMKRDESAFIQLHEVFVEEDSLYQVYKKLEGQLLAYRLMEGKMDWRESVHVLRSIVQQLMVMRENGEMTVVHPQNTILPPGGRVQFLYGGSKEILVKEGDMSPATSRSDEAANVYAIGMIAYMMITGISPVENPFYIQSLRSRCPEVPEYLSFQVMSSLAVQPQPRPTLDQWGEVLHQMVRMLGMEKET
ncbi:hypothetical protein [Mechercharimyces sp. CAU 1602]|uniref:hypothetical protein n=1 Tax=Mechercharimyces sp. CAU 1602 TaxID=2973933 RepID=UPI0021613D8E|nr:hypothetical protein [Mechercharimyces sp. CAU 1602]